MVVVGAGGVLAAGPLLMSVYAALLDDRYPSADDQQAVRLDLRYPDVHEELNRWLPLVKWLLAIPHHIVLVFLGLAGLRVSAHHRPLPAVLAESLIDGSSPPGDVR